MDMLDYEMSNAGSQDYPTYHFPGTYDAAKHDTLEAVKNVGSAASSFGSALGVAGIGKAVWSVGTLVGRGVRGGSKAVGSSATMGAIKLGYKDSLPTSVAQWAEDNAESEARKAEKKAAYKMAGVRYKNGDPRKYVLKKETGGGMQGKSIAIDDAADDDDWAIVDVTEGPEGDAGEHFTDYQDQPRASVYESVMTAVESTAGVTVDVAGRVGDVAGRVGRNVARAVRTVRAQPHDVFEQRKIAENWPKNLKELEVRNKVERRQSIPRHLDPNFEKVRDPRYHRPLYKRSDVRDTDDVEDDYEEMVLPEEDDQLGK